MVCCILMNIIQSGEIAPLIRQMCLSKVLPQPGSPGCLVQTIQLFRREAMQLLDHGAE